MTPHYCPYCEIQYVAYVDDAPVYALADLGYHAERPDGTVVPLSQIGDPHPECARLIGSYDDTSDESVTR